jgi:predicted  nucleic acid-binding Zn-ribbon protein
MSVWNKVLLGLIIVVSLVFLFLGYRVLKVHQKYRDQVADNRESIETTLASIEQVHEGSDQKTGLDELKLKLHAILYDRGRAWFHVTPANLAKNGDKIDVQVVTDLPDPNEVHPESIIYLFDETPAADGGKYLGSFKVNSVQGKQVSLTSEHLMNDVEFKYLQDSLQQGGTWAMYEAVPSDRQDIFDPLTEEELKQRVPENLIAYYQDSERKLRDYDLLLNNLYEKRAKLLHELASVTSSEAGMQEAVNDAKTQDQFRRAEIDDLDQQLTELKRQRDAVKKHLADVESMMKEIEQQIQEKRRLSKKLLGEIARIQLEASQKIESAENASEISLD